MAKALYGFLGEPRASMLLKQVEHFNREFVPMHRHWIERHQIGDQALAHFWVGLKLPGEIAVGEDAE